MKRFYKKINVEFDSELCNDFIKRIEFKYFQHIYDTEYMNQIYETNL